MLLPSRALSSVASSLVVALTLVDNSLLPYFSLPLTVVVAKVMVALSPAFTSVKSRLPARLPVNLAPDLTLSSTNLRPAGKVPVTLTLCKSTSPVLLNSMV